MQLAGLGQAEDVKQYITLRRTKTRYESNDDTNSFTDALLSKLNAIAAGAEVNRTLSKIQTIIMVGLVCLACVLLYSQCAEASGNVGVSYSQIIDDRSFGVTGDYETAISERVKFEADAQIQSGDIHNVKVHTNFIFDVSTVDLKLLIENKAKGYTLATLGREQLLFCFAA